MSTDLKIDLFARDLFDALWRQHGLRTELPKTKRPPMESEFNVTILKCVEARQSILHSTYEEIFESSHAEFYGNSSSFFHTIVDKFPHYWKWEDPDNDFVMCLFLCSCAFVADMTMWCKSKGDDFLDVADKAWAMFADLHLKDVFYVAGGWHDLQVFVEADVVVYDYVRSFSDMVHCNLGKNVLLHSTHLTIGAIESFHRFEEWPAVDDNAPLPLEWADYCILESERKFRPARFFKQATPSVFEELESTIYYLGLICNPYYPCEESDATEGEQCCPKQNVDFDRITSSHLNFDNTSPATPTSRFDTDRGKVEESVSGSNAVKLRATDPEAISRASEKPVYLIRLAAADNETSNIDGEEDKNSESLSSITEKENQEESLSETNNEKRDSEIADFEQDIIVVEKLGSSSEGETDSKDKKMDGESIPFHKNEPTVSRDSLEMCTMEADEALRKALSRLSSLGVSVTELNSADFSASNDSDESNMNTNPNDFDAIMDQLGLKKMSDYTSSDSKRGIKLYAIDSDNISKTEGSLKETPKSSFLSPHKSLLTSTDADVSNAPLKSPLNPSNVNVLNAPRKSPLTSPNVNTLSTPRKSPITSSNVNTLSTLRKSPITFSNVNTLSTLRKSPISSSNANTLSTLRKSPITSSNASVSSITDGNLHKRRNSSGPGCKRRGKRYTGKENFLSYRSKTEIEEISIKVSSSFKSSMEVKGRKSEENQEDRHPDNDSFSSKNLPYFKDDSNSSKQVKGQFLPDKEGEDNELVNLAKYSVKTYERTKQYKLENKNNDQINENSILDSQKTSERTIESSQTDHCVNDIKIINSSEYPSRTSTCEGLNLPQNQTVDTVGEKSSSYSEMPTLRCSDVPNQSTILTNDDENDCILEKSLTVFERGEMDDLSRPPVEKDHERGINRQISLNSSSTEINEITEGENSSAEPTLGNPFKFASGAEETKNNAQFTPDCNKSPNTENETTSAETTDEIPIGFISKKAKKSKQQLNSNDSNSEALQTSQVENMTDEPLLETPLGVPSAPQDVEKKGKKKKPKKRISRLEQRVKEEGNGVRDVMRLIFVMGHQPAMAHFASTLQNAEKQNSDDENNEE